MKLTGVLKLRPCIKVRFSSSGALLLRLSRDVEAWNLSTRSQRFRVRPLRQLLHCAIDPKEDQIAVKNTAGEIALLDATDGKLVRKLARATNEAGSNIAFCPTGEYVIDGSWNGELTVRSVLTGQVAFQSVSADEAIMCVASTRDGRDWFVVHQRRSTSEDQPPPPPYISIWKWPLSSPVDYLFCTELIGALAVSGDGVRLCIVGYESITVIRTNDKEVLAASPHSVGGTGFAAAWSPDGKEIATVQRDRFVFYDADTLEERDAVAMTLAADVDYSPTGDLVALGTWKSGMLFERCSAA